MGNNYNRVYIWCCKYGENRYCERCANRKLCASKHTGLLNSYLGKLCLHPYLVVPLISTRVTLISTRVSAHCQAIQLERMVRPYLILWTQQRHTVPHTYRGNYGVSRSVVSILEKSCTIVHNCRGLSCNLWNGWVSLYELWVSIGTHCNNGLCAYN